MEDKIDEELGLIKGKDMFSLEKKPFTHLIE